ncbi:Uncharacterised protein [Vibrio cholerae]|nr:Uncharacterised protein [Vibrio cholerae]CSC80076.1 Uncharacterised protein [Vibrio cholerae]CSC98175.1 Uncharacterised protein [Vibrio cholerae]
MVANVISYTPNQHMVFTAGITHLSWEIRTAEQFNTIGLL